MIERRFDEEAGIIRMKATGAWDAGEIDRHHASLQALIETVRQRSIPIRILANVREAPARPPAIEEQMRGYNASTYRPADRVAILTPSKDEDRVRTFLDGAGKWAWHSELAAEMSLFMQGDGPADDEVTQFL